MKQRLLSVSEPSWAENFHLADAQHTDMTAEKAFNLFQSRFDLFLRAESGTSFRSDSGVATDDAGGYGTLNLRADAQFNNGVTLVGEVQNITDRSYQPYGQLEGAERSVNLFLTKTF